MILYLPKPMHAELKRLADAEGNPMGAVLRRLISRELRAERAA